jgi:DNA mismatch endonuclease (patch repair protein)
VADVHSPTRRSYNMSRIKSKNTKPELLIRKVLHANGFRFRLHDQRLPGTPDIVLKKYMTLVFINGCFWHGHTNCKYYIIPKTRKDWWVNKINTTALNDKKNLTLLHEAGWKIITIWECELKRDKIQKTLIKLFTQIKMNRI